MKIHKNKSKNSKTSFLFFTKSLSRRTDAIKGKLGNGLIKVPLSRLSKL
jgi:hypothetical protein